MVTATEKELYTHRCDYCRKKLDRHIFCSASCKVRFHRGDKVKTVIPQAVNTKKEVEASIGFSEHKKPGYHFSEVLNGYVKD